MCGSFCTFSEAFAALAALRERFPEAELLPIQSDAAATTDTRFGSAAAMRVRLSELCGREPLRTLAQAEPIGPKKLLDLLIVCPCTGNTLAKLANGICDGPVTMACKAHLRNGRPLLLAPATNDALTAAAPNIATLLARRNVYFVPLRQDDPLAKPTSAIADFSLLPDAAEAALAGRQLQPVFR